MRVASVLCTLVFLTTSLACSLGGSPVGTWELTEFVSADGEREPYPIDISEDGFEVYAEQFYTLESGGAGSARSVGFTDFDGEREDFDDSVTLLWDREDGEVTIDVVGDNIQMVCTRGGDVMLCDHSEGGSFTAER